MAAEVTFVPLDQRGSAILDELQRETAVLPFRENVSSGARSYALTSVKADVSGFDPLLDRLASDWRGHLTRTP